ncbi:MAG TPA: c-type cytochrome [Lacunisphaera sp.]|nr:c-type cytochrome [Lacunisphaera sp.]
MKTVILLGIGLLGVLLLTGCDEPRRMGRGFVFPGGDAARGQKTFVEMECYRCHRVDGVPEIPAPPASAERVVVLGGQVAHVRTYGDLVTAIIHPQYSLSDQLTTPPRDGKSPMPGVNDRMRVNEMLDIVAFLQPRYKNLDRIQGYHGP